VSLNELVGFGFIVELRLGEEVSPGRAVIGGDTGSRRSVALPVRALVSCYTIHPSSLALSLASFQALVINSAPFMGMRGSSLLSMSFADSPREFFRLK
jgi:hypothetical protein